MTIATGSFSRSAASAGTQTITQPVILGANAVWDLAGSGQVIVSGEISGDYSLEKRGAGTLNLSGPNSYTGLTRVQNGTLVVSGGSTASPAFDVISGSTLSFTGGSFDMRYAAFTNAGTINFSGGAETLGGASFTNTGAIYLNGATLSFNSTTSVPGAVNFSSGSIGGSGQLSFQNLSWTGGIMSGAGNTTIPTGGTLSATVSGYKYVLARTLNDSGTITMNGAGYFCSIAGASPPVINVFSGATFDIHSDMGIGSFAGESAAINNSGIFKKSGGVGTSSISTNWTFNNAGTVQVQSGRLLVQGPVTQMPGTTLTGGTWQVLSNSTLDVATGGGITTNQGNVILDGLGSTFAKINTLANNQGNFSVLDGRNFTTASDLANSGTLTVGAGSAFTVNGDLSGAGDIVVNGALTADAVMQNTITFGPGATLTINAIPGGPVCNGSIRPVPEPGTLVTLMIAAAMAACLKKSARRITR